jgi:ABC-2 type transport system permease protein
MGSIISAIAARFIYPAISMEGKAFWILDKSPLKASVLYFSKYIFYALPTLVFAVVLSVISNRILTVPPAMVWVSHINMIMISLLISAQALTMGAIRPDFNEANVAGIPLSAGGLFYMVISLISIIIILALSAYPVIHLIRYNFFFSLLPHKIKIRAALCVCSWLFFCLAGLLISIKTGTKALNRIS